MSNEEWGPWVEHDGSGCPVVGQVVYVLRRSGETYGPYIANSEGPKRSENDPFFDAWKHLPKPRDIIRYRIRKPKGMAVLEDILREVSDQPSANSPANAM